MIGFRGRRGQRGTNRSGGNNKPQVRSFYDEKDSIPERKSLKLCGREAARRCRKKMYALGTATSRREAVGADANPTA
jgi:hypothetical protein